MQHRRPWHLREFSSSVSQNRQSPILRIAFYFYQKLRKKSPQINCKATTQVQYKDNTYTTQHAKIQQQTDTVKNGSDSNRRFWHSTISQHKILGWGIYTTSSAVANTGHRRSWLLRRVLDSSSYAILMAVASTGLQKLEAMSHCRHHPWHAALEINFGSGSFSSGFYTTMSTGVCRQQCRQWLVCKIICSYSYATTAACMYCQRLLCSSARSCLVL